MVSCDETGTLSKESQSYNQHTHTHTHTRAHTLKLYIYIYIYTYAYIVYKCKKMYRNSWRNSYRKNWTRLSEFKSWPRWFAFRIALISLAMVWIQLISFLNIIILNITKMLIRNIHSFQNRSIKIIMDRYWLRNANYNPFKLQKSSWTLFNYKMLIRILPKLKYKNYH